MAIESIAGLGMIASVIGGGTSAAGGILGGIAGSNAYAYKAQVAKNNAIIARQNAGYASAAGETEQRQQGLKDRYGMGRIVTDQAQGGLDVNSGSALDVRTSQAAINTENQTMIRNNATRKAYSFDVEAMNFETEAKMDKAAGDNAMTAGLIGGAGSLIGTASSVSDKWTKYRTAGVEGY